MSRRIVVEEPCEHGEVGYCSVGAAAGSRPRGGCPGGSRTVLTEPSEEMVERVAVAIVAFFDSWCDDTPFWPSEDLTISNHDIRDDARAALDAALFSSAGRFRGV